MVTKVILVTPEMAKSFLEKNTRNRPIRESRVFSYAQEMKNGNWQLTHQGIGISKSGVITDGQHRLRAILLSGCSVLMNVSFDCEDSSYNMIDVGLSRTVTDTTGVKSRYASIINKMFSIAHGNNVKISHISVLDIYTKHSELFDRLGLITAHGFTACAAVGAVCYLHNGGDSSKIKSFVNFMKHGVSKEINDALVFVGMKLIKNENRFRDSVDAAVMVFKGLSSGEKSKIIKTDVDSVESVKSFCKMIVGL